MRREDFEHLIAAAANVTGEDEFVVIGSQAVLGAFPAAPETMLRSMKADIYPLHRPEKADDIDGALGDGSQFEATFGKDWLPGVHERQRRHLAGGMSGRVSD